MDTHRPENPAFELMNNHLALAVRELFDAYGFAVDPSPLVEATSEPEKEGMAVIGYAGNGLRGAVILIATEPTVCAWMTAADLSDGEVADTLGEFSNMLLGRLKAKLLGEGIVIFATTPTTATGVGLRLSNPPGQCAWCTFDGPDWRVTVRLDAKFDRGFEPDLSRKAAPPALAGGFIEF